LLFLLYSDHNVHFALLPRVYVPSAMRILQRGTAKVCAATVNAHHINVKPTVRHLTKLPSVPCCVPCYTSRCTTCCYTRSHVCEPPLSHDFLSDMLWLAAIRMWRCGRCGQENHTCISLYRSLIQVGPGGGS